MYAKHLKKRRKKLTKYNFLDISQASFVNFQKIGGGEGTGQPYEIEKGEEVAFQAPCSRGSESRSKLLT